MTQHRLLHLGTVDDHEYSHRLSTITNGAQVAWKQRLSTPGTIAELEFQCKAAGITGVVCSNQDFLEKLLYAQDDFIPPNNKRGVTLNDYQGSLLFTAREKIPVVIIRPLPTLVSVRYATEAAKRFVSKLTTPDKWFPQTAFTWELFDLATVETIFTNWLAESALISVDIETPIENPLRKINCVGFCAYFPKTNTSETLVIPVTSLLNLHWVRKFCDLPQPKIFQNGLYDNLYLLRWRCPVRNWLYDTQHLFHSWYSEYPKRLDFITAWSVRVSRYWKDDGKTGNLSDYYRYNAQDCWATLNSFLSLVKEAPAWAFNNYITEFPLVFPCLTCEIEGIARDEQRFAAVTANKQNEVEQMNIDFQKMIAAPGFNVNSPPQVLKLFGVLGLSSLKSTNKANMLKAQASSSFNGKVLSYVTKIRKSRKVLSTYLVDGKFWQNRLYYKLNPAGTDTGRLASSESSYWCGLQIQNIPAGDTVKQCLISDPGWLLCEIDKAQSEARCVAYLSGEEALIKLVESENDYHSWNAAAFFGRAYDTIYDNNYINKDGSKGKKLDPVLRDLAKRTNHGANYNMGAEVMLETMGPKNVSMAKITLKLKMSLKSVCQFLLDRYSATYPKVKGLWYESIIKEVALTGKLTSPLGHVRHFFKKPHKGDKPALNASVAHPPQNLSVALINLEFYNVWRCQIYGGFYKQVPNLLWFSDRHRIDKNNRMEGTYENLDLRNKIRIKAQIHDSIFFQHRTEHADVPTLVRDRIMVTRIPVRGADGVSRNLFIPSDISASAHRWSELK